MRGPPAPDHGYDHQVAGSDRGYVLSFDLSGPHTGDNDGNFWVLHAVETSVVNARISAKESIRGRSKPMS